MIGELIGWIGGLLLSICAAPQAFLCIKNGNADGLSTLTIWIWLFGEILCAIYVAGWIVPISWPLLFNYTFNILMILVFVKYKYWPRKKENV